jgi:hypothetical protein
MAKNPYRVPGTGTLLWILSSGRNDTSDGLNPSHSLRSAIIGSTAEARLAGNRQANAATPSSRNDAARSMRGLLEAFSTH